MCNVHAGRPCRGGGKCMQGVEQVEWSGGGEVHAEGGTGAHSLGQADIFGPAKGFRPGVGGWLLPGNSYPVHSRLGRIEWSRRWQRVQIHQDRRGGVQEVQMRV